MISCLASTSTDALYYIWSHSSKIVVLVPLACFAVASLVHWYSETAAGLCLLLTLTIIDPLTADRQSARCHRPGATQQMFLSTLPFFRSSVASWIQKRPHNNSNYNPSPQQGIEPLPLLFSQSPALSAEPVCWLQPCPHGSTTACPPINAVLTGRSEP